MESPMAPLLSASDSSSESELSAADSKPPSTTSWLSFNPLENHLKNPKKSLSDLLKSDKSEKSVEKRKTSATD